MIKLIEEFLKEKPGYLKEGAKRLKKVIFNRLRKEVTLEECRQAVRNVNQGYTNYYVHKSEDINELLKATTPSNDIPEGFEIKSKWQSASGEWLMSLRPIDNDKEEVISEDYYEVFKDIVGEHKHGHVIEPSTTARDLDLKVWMSDKHVGSIGSQDNEYSELEFALRMNATLEHIFDLVAEHGPFKTITIADLGDALDGMDSMTVSRKHKLKQNLNNTEAFEVYFREHKIFMDRLLNSGAAENYNMWEVLNANHDGDFGYICKRALMAYIEGVYPEVNVVGLPDFMDVIEHEDITYVLTHGKDKENRFKGLPLFPNPQVESFIEAFLKRKNVGRNDRIRLIKGDLHQYAISPCKNIECYKTVPSMMGTTDWILTNFEATSAGVAYEILDLNTRVISESVFKL